MNNQTLCIIKPDVVGAGELGALISHLEKEFKILRMTMFRFYPEGVLEFYENLDQTAPWFTAHAEFMCSGPCVALVLFRVEGEAIVRLRQIVGPTNPENNDLDTLRGMFGTKLPRNAVHASDSPSSFERESKLIFGDHW